VSDRAGAIEFADVRDKKFLLASRNHDGLASAVHFNQRTQVDRTERSQSFSLSKGPKVFLTTFWQVAYGNHC
jgi:hypothetical protein